MDILMSLHNKWSQMILSKNKTIEFRTRLPKNIKQGTKIYIYETGKNNGIKKVVGECEVDYIISVLNEEGEWPIYGAYPFIDYYFENIKKDKKSASFYRNLKKEFDKYENYRYGFILGYALSELELKNLRETGKLIDTFKISDYDLVKQIIDDNTKSNNNIEECDNWLMKIGFYNECEESYYKYGIVLKNILQYKEPIEIERFVDKNGVNIKKAPQSWMYVKKVQERIFSDEQKQ